MVINPPPLALESLNLLTDQHLFVFQSQCKNWTLLDEMCPVSFRPIGESYIEHLVEASKPGHDKGLAE